MVESNQQKEKLNQDQFMDINRASPFKPHVLWLCIIACRSQLNALLCVVLTHEAIAALPIQTSTAGPTLSQTAGFGQLVYSADMEHTDL